MNIEKIIHDVIDREGGYVNHPADRGGPTKYGITAATLGRWLMLERAATADEVFLLSKRDAAAIYRQFYYIDPGFSQIHNEDVAALVVDCAILHGTRRATILLQRAIGVEDDGIIGPQTLRALREFEHSGNTSALVADITKLRLLFVADILVRDKKQLAFAAGWIRRCAEFL